MRLDLEIRPRARSAARGRTAIFDIVIAMRVNVLVLDDVFDLYAGLQGEDIEDTDSLAASVGARHTLKLPGGWTWRICG